MQEPAAAGLARTSSAWRSEGGSPRKMLQPRQKWEPAGTRPFPSSTFPRFMRCRVLQQHMAEGKSRVAG